MASKLLNNTEQLNLIAWLKSLGGNLALNTESITPVAGDASFRRYFKIKSDRGDLIIMYAAGMQASTKSFIDICNRLNQTGIIVPEIISQDQDKGFLLLNNLGQNFLHCIESGKFSNNDQELQLHYRGALKALVQMQASNTSNLPVFDANTITKELDIFKHWYLEQNLGFKIDADCANILHDAFTLLAKKADQQPKIFVHRDFHSPNLMLLPESEDYIPGVIDFQDAVYGPISYDIASLVMDARTTWEEPQQIDWAIRYWEFARAAGLQVPDDFAQFHIDYEWMSLQRNLRILGVFIRLSKRDNKHHYLNHIPRVQAYIRQVASRYNLFHPLLRLLDQAENVPTTDGFSF